MLQYTYNIYRSMRDSSDYLLWLINYSLKGLRNFNILIIFIFVICLSSYMLSSIFLCVMGSVFIYIIKFIIKLNTVIKLALK